MPEALQLLPTNGLNSSLHVPIFIGLMVLAVFRETFGWTFVGLVVPGYLATVFVAAPVTGGLVVAESILAYWLAAVLGRWLARAGVWSTAFGRERFLLLIIAAVAVRVALEGFWLQWILGQLGRSHSRDLYSLGLVLVPLLANSYWNDGLIASVPRIALVTGLTFVVVNLLLNHTNFTVSRFQLANESVSLAFLESPHAQIILVVGAALAARNNVLYGWDYNGILVPALLGVAWYEPTKLATTILEAVVVYAGAVAASRLPPMSRMLLVGSRRLALCFTVGLVIKWVTGYALMLWAPGVEMVDYFGFGYLLPSLLAVKFWNAQRLASVVMPTLQVSIAAFIVGNAGGFALAFAEQREKDGELPRHPKRPEHPIPFEMLLADSAPAPRSSDAFSGALTPGQVALALARELDDGPPRSATLGLAERASLRVVSDDTSHFHMIGPRADDPNDDRIAPRLALRAKRPGTRPWLVIAETRQQGDPVAVVAFDLAERLNARAVLLRSFLPTVRSYDDAFAAELGQAIDLEVALRVRSFGEKARLSVVAGLPEGLSPGHLKQLLGAPVELDWRPASGSSWTWEDAPQLAIPPSLASQLAATRLGAPAVEPWSGNVPTVVTERLNALTEVRPGAYHPPSVEERRLLGPLVAEPLLALGENESPTTWHRAAAAQLGYRIARIGTAQPVCWALFESESEHRRGHATWVVRSRASGARRPSAIAVEIPAPRWEQGVVSAGLRLFEAVDARALLMHGALPNAAPDRLADSRTSAGRQTYFQRLHESWLAAEGQVVSVRGIPADKASATDVVFTFGSEVDGPMGGPGWTAPLVESFDAFGLDVEAFDGTWENAAFESHSPDIEYARQFARERMALIWLSPALRARFVSFQQDAWTAQRLEQGGHSVTRARVVDRALALAACGVGGSLRQSASGCPEQPARSACDLEAVHDRISKYSTTRNPYALMRALTRSDRCHTELLTDAATDHLWLIAAGNGAILLEPLRGLAVETVAGPVQDASELARLVALGLGPIRVEAP